MWINKINEQLKPVSKQDGSIYGYLLSPDGKNVLRQALDESLPHIFMDARVLLVEDNKINQMVASEMLDGLGAKVEICSNGAEAVEVLRQNKFDLILMDCQMPVMDGFSAVAVIRDMENGRERTPIVALTAHAIAGDREKCIAAGMDDYLAKPFTENDLRSILEKWVGDGMS
jgi:CheY-like chemotaxis protein